MRISKIFGLLAAMGVVACGNDDSIQGPPPVESQAQFEINGAFESTELFGKKDKAENISIVSCHVSDNGELSFSSYELASDADFEMRVPRLIQFYDSSKVFDGGGLGTIEVSSAKHIDAVVVLSKDVYQLSEGSSCFVSYTESTNVNEINGEISCTSLVNLKKPEDSVSLQGDFRCDRSRGELDLQLIDKNQ